MAITTTLRTLSSTAFHAEHERLADEQYHIIADGAATVRAEIATVMATLFTGKSAVTDAAVKEIKHYPGDEREATDGREAVRVSMEIDAAVERLQQYQADLRGATAAVLEQYDPQLLETDRARLRSVQEELSRQKYIVLTTLERKRLLGGLGQDERQIAWLRFEHFAAPTVLVPDESVSGTEDTEQGQIFLEKAVNFIPWKVRLRVTDSQFEDGSREYILEFEHPTCQPNHIFHQRLIVHPRREEEFRSFFDENTQGFLASKSSRQDIWDRLGKFSATMRVPHLGPLPTVHNDAHAFALRTELFDEDYLRHKYIPKVIYM
ncbi:MAG: hypothetical protein Greene041619_577 [Candidatus Peregrinibacteria bacterium Greene0416_19]|nr:MAG: hypothetical protein Greene041619_577 [Candidatus Peregrinibacteria bacterium Greene0416_19]